MRKDWQRKLISKHSHRLLSNNKKGLYFPLEFCWPPPTGKWDSPYQELLMKFNRDMCPSVTPLPPHSQCPLTPFLLEGRVNLLSAGVCSSWFPSF